MRTLLYCDRNHTSITLCGLPLKWCISILTIICLCALLAGIYWVPPLYGQESDGFTLEESPLEEADVSTPSALNENEQEPGFNIVDPDTPAVWPLLSFSGNRCRMP